MKFHISEYTVCTDVLNLPSLTPNGFIHPWYTAGRKGSSFAPALFTSPDQIL